MSGIRYNAFTGMAMKKILLLSMPLLLLISCASIQRSQDVQGINKFSRLINAGEAERLTRMSKLPFLLDQEIIVLNRDINTLWTNVTAAGYRVEEPTLERGETVTEDSYREFYDSMEVKTFFKKYLKKNTRLLELETSSGQRILLLFENRLFSRQLRGFKGPY